MNIPMRDMLRYYHVTTQSKMLCIVLLSPPSHFRRVEKLQEPMQIPRREIRPILQSVNVTQHDMGMQERTLNPVADELAPPLPEPPAEEPVETALLLGVDVAVGPEFAVALPPPAALLPRLVEISLTLPITAHGVLMARSLPIWRAEYASKSAVRRYFRQEP